MSLRPPAILLLEIDSGGLLESISSPGGACWRRSRFGWRSERVCVCGAPVGPFRARVHQRVEMVFPTAGSTRCASGAPSPRPRRGVALSFSLIPGMGRAAEWPGMSALPRRVPTEARRSPCRARAAWGVVPGGCPRTRPVRRRPVSVARAVHGLGAADSNKSSCGYVGLHKPAAGSGGSGRGGARARAGRRSVASRRRTQPRYRCRRVDDGAEVQP